MRITKAEFLNNYESVAEKAASETVIITRDCRDHLVLPNTPIWMPS